MTGLLAVLIALAPVANHQVQHACVAMSVFGEARGEPARGQRLVAAVIRNRIRAKQWPDTACAVVLQKRQFRGALTWLHGRHLTPAEILDAFVAASNPADGRCAGATYFTRVEEHPSWMASLETLCTVGHHKFMVARR